MLNTVDSFNKHKVLNEDSDTASHASRLGFGTVRASNQRLGGRSILSPIPYQGQAQKLNQATIKEFGLNQEDQKKSQGTTLHKVDHIKQNVRIAGNIS